MTEWQDISTAPKDAEIIIGRAADEDGLGAYVSQGFWIAMAEDQVDQPGHDEGFVDCNCSYFHPARSFGSEKSRYEGCQPTHWQPLPSRPAPSLARAS